MNLQLEELDHEYSPSRWSRRFGPEEVLRDHVKTSIARGREAQEVVPHRLEIPYGEKPRSKVDVFGESLPNDSPVLIYVHGGYWQELSKSLSYYPVVPLYKNCIVTVVLGYTLAPKSSVAEIVEEVRHGMKWVLDFASNRNSKGVILMGWSAGAQLITQVLSTTKSEDSRIYERIKGFITLSGVFDLRPLTRTYVNKVLYLDETSAWNVSPARLVAILSETFPGIKALIVTGEHDSNEFKRQSKQYYQDLQESGIVSYYEEISDADHFNLVEDLSFTDYKLTLRIIDFINEACK